MPSFSQAIHIEDDIEERMQIAWDYQPSDGGVHNQNFVVMCVISPDGTNQRCPDLAIKIFGCFPTQEGADKYAQKLSSENNFFDYFVATTRDWLKLPPQVASIEDVHYQESALSDIQKRIVDMRSARAQLMQEQIAEDKLARKAKQLENQKQQSSAQSSEQVGQTEEKTNSSNTNDINDTNASDTSDNSNMDVAD